MSAAAETTTVSPKDRALATIARLPDDVTWDDIAYHVKVCRKIDIGCAQADAGRTITHEEAGRLLGVAKS